YLLNDSDFINQTSTAVLASMQTQTIGVVSFADALVFGQVFRRKPLVLPNVSLLFDCLLSDEHCDDHVDFAGANSRLERRTYWRHGGEPIRWHVCVASLFGTMCHSHSSTS